MAGIPPLGMPGSSQRWPPDSLARTRSTRISPPLFLGSVVRHAVRADCVPIIPPVVCLAAPHATARTRQVRRSVRQRVRVQALLVVPAFVCDVSHPCPLTHVHDAAHPLALLLVLAP